MTDPSPGEGDVPPRDFLQVVHRCRLASEAVVGVVVGHDGGGPQLAELAVWALQLQLNGLQLCVFPPVHCKARKHTRKFIRLLRIPQFSVKNKTKETPLPHLLPYLFLLRSTTCTTAFFVINRTPLRL